MEGDGGEWVSGCLFPQGRSVLTEVRSLELRIGLDMEDGGMREMIPWLLLPQLAGGKVAVASVRNSQPPRVAASTPDTTPIRSFQNCQSSPEWCLTTKRWCFNSSNSIPSLSPYFIVAFTNHGFHA